MALRRDGEDFIVVLEPDRVRERSKLRRRYPGSREASTQGRGGVDEFSEPNADVLSPHMITIIVDLRTTRAWQ
jgi:hypothetical protein